MLPEIHNWWANKSTQEKTRLINKYFSDCSLEDIEEDDIEFIYNKEDNLNYLKQM